MVTVSAELESWPSLTTREKVRLWAVAGAVKVGRWAGAVELERVTAGPAVWVQA